MLCIVMLFLNSETIGVEQVYINKVVTGVLL